MPSSSGADNSHPAFLPLPASPGSRTPSMTTTSNRRSASTQRPSTSHSVYSNPNPSSINFFNANILGGHSQQQQQQQRPMSSGFDRASVARGSINNGDSSSKKKGKKSVSGKRKKTTLKEFDPAELSVTAKFGIWLMGTTPEKLAAAAREGRERRDRERERRGKRRVRRDGRRESGGDLEEQW